MPEESANPPRPIHKLLAANRSEIAIRVFRTANELGIRTVAIYSHEDRFALHRFKADEAYRVGKPGEPIRAYLDIPGIVALAKQHEVDAVHPGYGFLSENPAFARACVEAGLTFVGPRVAILEQLGDKVVARRIARQAGVPILPGTDAAVRSDEEAHTLAEQIGYPVIVKAAMGGGGRGMRVAPSADKLADALDQARREVGQVCGVAQIGRSRSAASASGTRTACAATACDSRFRAVFSLVIDRRPLAHGRQNDGGSTLVSERPPREPSRPEAANAPPVGGGTVDTAPHLPEPVAPPAAAVPAEAADLAALTRDADPPPQWAGFHLTPGMLLSNRYRIVAPLGRGGMGDVYRADDLALGVSVALKFLPDRVAADPDRLARFRGEVAAARQVAHPHVCRVYDIGESDGRAFLSMEFIPGDDLEAVLRRAGRLTPGVAMDLVRQVALGLQAVHDEGLIHRDLKPANVMLDGRGRAKLTDFGLAASAESVSGEHALAGSLLYQAPEQLAGGTLSVRTDVYALGLLLYLLLTGRRPFAASDRGELLRLQRETRPVQPSALVAGVPPAVDQLVLRCLSPDPRDRPASAHEVWRTLPGDDALQAALAAGQTPTPQVVADAGGEGRLRRRTALALLAVFVLGTAAACVLHDQTSSLRVFPAQPPDQLADVARRLLSQLGNDDRPAATARQFALDANQVRWHNQHDRGPNRTALRATGRLSMMPFWYRQSVDALVPEFHPEEPPFVTWDNPLPGRPGSARVLLDGRGRLLVLEQVPLHRRESGPAAGPDWGRLFAAAGLDPDGFHAVPPEWEWGVRSDTQAAWSGTVPERSDLPLRVEAAAERGEVVGFRLVPPWDPGPVNSGGAPGLAAKALRITIQALMLLVGGALAWLHLRAGRADLAGAAKFTGVYALVSFGLRVAVLPRTANLSQQFGLYYGVAGLVLHDAATLALAYVALEPFVRRRWPELLIGWARLLAGRWRDPWVGRDLLIGAAAGAVWAAGTAVAHAAAGWLGFPPEVPHFGWVDLLEHPLCWVPAAFMWAVHLAW
jgi:serine/threonine-protein kinase